MSGKFLITMSKNKTNILLYLLLKNASVFFISLFIICLLLALVPDTAIPGDVSYFERVKDYLTIAYLFSYDYSVAGTFLISELILHGSKLTFTLIFLSLLIVLTIALPAGILVASEKNTNFQKLFTVTVSLLSPIPILIWASLLMLLVFVFGNMVPLYIDFEDGDLRTRMFVLLIPVAAIVLGDGILLDFYNKIRDETRKVMNEPWLIAVKARGLPIYNHVLRALLLPIFITLSSKITYLISGIIIVEYIFAWQGLGFMIWRSLETPGAKDYPLILGSVKVLLFTVFLFSFIRDILTYKLNPQLMK